MPPRLSLCCLALLAACAAPPPPAAVVAAAPQPVGPGNAFANMRCTGFAEDGGNATGFILRIDETGGELVFAVLGEGREARNQVLLIQRDRGLRWQPDGSVSMARFTEHLPGGQAFQAEIRFRGITATPGGSLQGTLVLTGDRRHGQGSFACPRA